MRCFQPSGHLLAQHGHILGITRMAIVSVQLSVRSSSFSLFVVVQQAVSQCLESNLHACKLHRRFCQCKPMITEKNQRLTLHWILRFNQLNTTCLFVAQRTMSSASSGCISSVETTSVNSGLHTKKPVLVTVHRTYRIVGIGSQSLVANEARTSRTALRTA